MIMIGIFFVNFINVVSWSVFVTKSLTLGILFSTKVRELAVAKLVILDI